MKIYTVYAKENDPQQLENIVLVEEGFSWFAAIFHVFYALYNKLWVVSLIIFAIQMVLLAAETNNLINIGIIDAIRVGLLLLIGAGFNDWKRDVLEKKGYIFQDIVSGKNEEEALYKYTSFMLHRSTFGSGNNHPDLVY